MAVCPEHWEVPARPLPERWELGPEGACPGSRGGLRQTRESHCLLAPSLFHPRSRLAASGWGPGWLLATPVCPGATFEATTPCVVQSEAMAEASRRLLRHSDLAPRPTPGIQVRAQVGTQLLLPTMSR